MCASIFGESQQKKHKKKRINGQGNDFEATPVHSDAISEKAPATHIAELKVTLLIFLPSGEVLI